MRNFLALAGAESVAKLLTFAALAYVARRAGPAGFGIVEFAGAAMLCAGLLVDQGLSAYGARELARDPARTGALAAEIVGARCLLAVAAFACVAALALWLRRPPPATLVLLLYGLSLFAMPFLLQWVFQGHDRMGVVAVSQMIRQAVFAAGVFAGLGGGSRLWAVPAAECAGAASAAAYTILTFRRGFGTALRPSLRFSAGLFREGLPIGLSQMFWVVRMFGATVIVGLLATPSDVGFFGGAQRILVALHTFVWLYFFNLLPALARSWQEGSGAFRAAIDPSIQLVTWAAAAVAVTWVAAAPAVMPLVYGAPFAAAGATLQWLAGVCAIAAVSGHYRFGLIAAGHQTTEMVTAALGAATALCAVPFGYRLGGPAGAAAGLVVAELAVWLSAWAYGTRLLGLTGHVPRLAGPAALTVGGVLLVRSSSSPVLGGLIALLAIATALAATRRRWIPAVASLARGAVRAPTQPAP